MNLTADPADITNDVRALAKPKGETPNAAQVDAHACCRRHTRRGRARPQRGRRGALAALARLVRPRSDRAALFQLRRQAVGPHAVGPAAALGQCLLLSRIARSKTRTPAHGRGSLFIECAYGCFISGCSHREIRPPTTPPRIGATQNSHSDVSAMPPPKIAVAVERAGLTEAFEIGMAMR